MSRATVQFNDYVSLAVMLLMLVALLGGQSGSTAHAEEPFVLAEADNSHVLTIDFDGQFGDNEVTIKLVADKDLSHFRGEDE